MDIILLLALFAEQELTSRNCSNLIQLSFSSSGFFSSGNRLKKIGSSDTKEQGEMSDDEGSEGEVSDDEGSEDVVSDDEGSEGDVSNDDLSVVELWFRVCTVCGYWLDSKDWRQNQRVLVLI